MTNDAEHVEPLQQKSATFVPVFSDSLSSRDSELSLLDLIKIFRKNGRIVAVFTSCATLIALVYSLLAPPVFQVKLVAEPQGEDGELGRQALAILNSFSFLENYIENENLLPWLLQEKWDEKKQDWVDADSSVPSLREGALYMKKHIVVQQPKNDPAGVVVVGFRSTDPARAAEVLNSMISLINTSLASSTVRLAKAKVNYYERQLDMYDPDSTGERVPGALRSTTANNQAIVTSKAIREQLIDFGSYMVRQNLIDELMLYKNLIIEAEAQSDQFALRVFDPATVPEKQEKEWPRAVLLVPSALLGSFFLILFFLLVKGVFEKLMVHDDE